MFFSKTFIATAALCLSLSLQANAHAAVAPALGVKGTPVRNDVQRPSKNSECGNVNIAQTIDTSTAVQAAGNGTFAATIINFNAGVDGSRQVTALVDPTGTGKSFVSADVLQNGDKNPSNTGSQQLVVQLPSNTKCSGGASKDKCLVSFTTVSGFGNCVVVQQAGGSSVSDSNTNASTAAPAASTSAAVSATKATATAAGQTATQASQGAQSTTGSLTAAEKAELEKLLKELENKLGIREERGSRAARTVRYAKDA
ncbi:hypothetical protein BN946_scf184938.g23 [Trametes cinnabarina]|uniref:Uncharacterized protein n=1 Tax=Pycnoporus cinnabarinus TaxID=5643 RepID=A0A060S1W5_PYCCI|nr:hypothetical protein BN946_scf184938.g23 [Trametes cinnabarina]